EERRLCYVGMTRARDLLFCMHALERRLHGRFREQNPSPFLGEIPEHVKEEVRLASSYRAPQQQSWREQPIRQRGAAGFSPPKANSGLKPAAPQKKNDSVNGVLSFFQNAPVQFDPNAIRAVKSQGEGARSELTRGAKVRHEQFGVGTILTMEGSGPDAKLTVYFERVGSKKFIARFAKL